MSLTELQKFVKDWNVQYPIDWWWRNKFNIPFGSTQHINANMIDMRFAYEEEVMYKALHKKWSEKDSDEDKEHKSAEYKPGFGNWIDTSKKFVEATRKEVDDIDITNIDLDSFLDDGSITIPNG